MDPTHQAKRPKPSPAAKPDSPQPQPNAAPEGKSAEQLWREDLHRRLNSALGSGKSKAQPPQKTPAAQPKQGKPKSLKPWKADSAHPPAAETLFPRLVELKTSHIPPPAAKEPPRTQPASTSDRGEYPERGVAPATQGPVRRGGWVPAIKEEPGTVPPRRKAHKRGDREREPEAPHTNGVGSAGGDLGGSGPPGFDSSPGAVMNPTEELVGSPERSVGGMESGGGLLRVVEDIPGVGSSGVELDGPSFQYGADYISL